MPFMHGYRTEPESGSLFTTPIAFLTG